MCEQKCNIPSSEIQIEKFQCSAKAANGFRCQRNQKKMNWTVIGDLHYPVCFQHEKKEFIPFAKTLGLPAKSLTPYKEQGYGITNDCHFVRREAKYGIGCQVDKTKIAETTCWRDASGSKTKAYLKDINQCINKQSKRKKIAGSKKTLEKEKKKKLLYSEKIEVQGVLTKIGAKSPLYEQFAWQVMKSLTNIVNEAFPEEAWVILKGSRSLSIALNETLRTITNLANVFPFFKCHVEEEKKQIGAILPPSDYDLVIQIKPDEKETSESYNGKIEVMRTVVNDIFLNNIEEVEKDPKRMQEYRDLFKSVALTFNKEEEGKEGAKVELIERESFEIADEDKEQFIHTSEIVCRKFLANVIFKFDKQKLQERDFLYFRLPEGTPFIDLTEVEISFGWDPTSYSAFYQKFPDRYRLDYKMTFQDWSNIHFAMIEDEEQETGNIILPMFRVYPKSHKSFLYISSMPLQFIEKAKRTFVLNRLMTSYLLEKKGKTKGKTKAEIVDVGIEKLPIATYKKQEEYFYQFRDEYTSLYNEVLIGNIKYHLKDLTRLLAEETRTKGAKDIKRFQYLRNFLCCILKLSSEKITTKCGVCPMDKKGKKLTNKQMQEELIRKFMYLGHYEAKKSKDQKGIERITKVIRKLPKITIEFIYNFLMPEEEKLELSVEKNEARSQLKKVLIILKASQKKDSCTTFKTFITLMGDLFQLKPNEDLEYYFSLQGL